MKKSMIIVMLVFVLFIGNNSFVSAMSQGDIREDSASLCYSLQTVSGNIKILTLEGDFGILNNLAITTLYSHSDDNQFLNAGVKMKTMENNKWDMLLLAGAYIPLEDDGKRHPLIGVIGETSISTYVDLNVGMNFLLAKETDYVGFEFGFTYQLDNNWNLEGGFRRVAGDKHNEGLSFGIRNYF